jgi:putative hydrolase of HD superfamily
MNVIKFLEVIAKLKGIKRTGWVKRRVKDPESVADHSLMMSLMGLSMPIPEGCDRNKIVKMSIIHDLAESVTGDIITKESWPEGGTMTSKERLKIEKTAMRKILSNLDGPTSKEIMDLWKEYIDGKTSEAIFTRDLDIAEMIIQALRYHDKGNFKDSLEGFWGERNLNNIQNKNIKDVVRKHIEKGR